MSGEDLKRGLEYIAASPPQEEGGFDETVIDYAKAALAEINRMRMEILRLEILARKEASREVA